MKESLGLSISNNIIRYAKIRGNSKELRIEKIGLKFYNGNPKIAINEIIEETNSEKAIINTNTIDENYYYSNPIIENNDKIINQKIDTEFENFCISRKFSKDLTIGKNLFHNEFNKIFDRLSENVEYTEQIIQPQNTEYVENFVNEENILPQEIQEVKENLHEIVNNVQENPFETGNVPENIFEGNEETEPKHDNVDVITEELQVDTNNFSGISEGFVQKEVKAEENVISNDVENNDINEENLVKEEKKEKKIEIPSFMK